MQTLWQDLRYGVRMLIKKPGFTLIAIVTLALGIGANTAIFSLIDALMLRPLPGVDDPARLASVYTSDFSSSLYSSSSYPDYVDLRDQNEVFSDLAAFALQPIHLSTGAEAERVAGGAVTGNYFATLGVKPALGRTLLPEDDVTSEGHQVAVISFDMWRTRFNLAQDVIGRTVQLNGHSFSIVGVAAEEFKGTGLRSVLSVWVPLGVYVQLSSPGAGSSPLVRRGSRSYQVVGRLKPGITPAQAQANVTALASQLAQAYPQSNMGTLRQPDQPRPMNVIPLNEAMVGPDARDATKRFGFMLMAVVGLVLLIACANIANLLLARAHSRQKEIAVRLAMGASRWRIVRQMLTESMFLSLLGGSVGLLLALWLSDELLSFDALAAFSALSLSLDWRVLVFSIVLSLLTGALFGLVPALQASRPDLAPALKNTESESFVSRKFGLRNLLVVFQIALSLVLLAGAGLFLRSLQRAYAADFGFDTNNALLASVDMGRQGYSEAQARIFYPQLVERAQTLPGVREVSLAQYIPVSADGSRTTINIEGYTAQPGEDLELNFNIVDTNFFHALGIPLVAGRGFGEEDTGTSPKVMVINEAMARRFWPGQSTQEVVGKRVNFRGQEGGVEVVGVARTGKYRDLREAPVSYMYLPLSQNYRPRLTLFIRTAGDSALLMPALRAEVQKLDRTLALFDVKTLDEHLGRALAQERTNAWLIGGFSLLALLLAAVGLYGVMSYAVTQRTRELGIRMALGARPRDVLRLVLGQGMMVTLIGQAIGLGGALALTRVIERLMYNVSVTDPATFAVMVLLLTCVALISCFVPARRASKVDPMVALRYE